VTFHLAVTNDQPNDLGPVTVTDYLKSDTQFVSASSSQGQCTFEPTHGENGIVDCDLGSLPAGGTAEIVVVVVPQESGILNNQAWASMLWNGNNLLAKLAPQTPASVYVYPA
jgi:uncharacterized repeat protein (TIGR01451 family)